MQRESYVDRHAKIFRQDKARHSLIFVPQLVHNKLGLPFNNSQIIDSYSLQRWNTWAFLKLGHQWAFLKGEKSENVSCSSSSSFTGFHSRPSVPFRCRQFRSLRAPLFCPPPLITLQFPKICLFHRSQFEICHLKEPQECVDRCLS